MDPSLTKFIGLSHATLGCLIRGQSLHWPLEADRINSNLDIHPPSVHAPKEN